MCLPSAQQWYRGSGLPLFPGEVSQVFLVLHQSLPKSSNSLITLRDSPIPVVPRMDTTTLSASNISSLVAPASIAEFVCDIHARASEFGTDVRDWVKGSAARRFGFTVQSRVYKDVKYFLDLLLQNPF